jgi:ABC-type dipeptide/oligopeptide/nickel transport system permease component
LVDVLRKPWVAVAARRIGGAVLVLAVIAYLTLFGLLLAQRGQQGLPADPSGAAVEAFSAGANLLLHHPAHLVWHHQSYSPGPLVRMLFLRSGALLGLGLLLAVIIGVPLGALAAVRRQRRRASLVVIASILGISTPSFMLGMLFWMADIWVHKTFDVGVLPTSGFGWDLHLILPALVLAARPVAQVMQVTYVSLSDILEQDYVRTARSKGLIHWVVLTRHALSNAGVPILTTLGTSLRFSLASLPVVEFFFGWPGLGLSLLDAIQAGDSALVVDLILALGALFLVVNAGLEMLFPVLDPRLRAVDAGVQRQDVDLSWTAIWRRRVESVCAWIVSLRGVSGHGRTKAASLRSLPVPKGQPEGDVPVERQGLGRLLRQALRSPSLILGSLLLAGLLVAVSLGPRFSGQSPFKTHGVMMFEGTISAPPYPPSMTFPWGTDILGRDLQALVLAGAKQTIVLALLATLARLSLGTVMGALAGWWRGGGVDRLVSGAVGVWASYPSTLFAMILILALGIKQGVGVFVLALSVVGWGEVAQFVRSKVVAIKTEPYVEGARVIGARDMGILIRHVVPNLVPSLLVLAMLEMGGVLLLLAELGFLNIFLGGGFTVELLGTQSLAGIPYHYSDVPEWGALLANVRDWWRAYPWLGWYPGVAFFLAILTFNLLGEGLRRFIDRSRINLSRWVNRYALVVGALIALGGFWLIRSSAPLSRYLPQAERFDAQRAMAVFDTLSSAQFEGRESGTLGATAAADYLAGQMRAIGLFPGGDNETYEQTLIQAGVHLDGMPELARLSSTGDTAERFVYRRDFVEDVGGRGAQNSVEGRLVGVALGPPTGAGDPDPYGLRDRDLVGAIVIVHQADLPAVLDRLASGVLVIADHAKTLQRKDLYKSGRFYINPPGFRVPMMFVSAELADRLLHGAGSSLTELDSERGALKPGGVYLTAPGDELRMTIPLTDTSERGEPVINVIGYIPGEGAAVRTAGGASLDSQVIIVSAYYDGVGTGPDGQLYPGANDNASGVAAMLEMARILMDTPYPPKKTIIFVAWSGGERGAGFSVTNTMNAKIGFNQLTVEAVLELSGLAQGSGEELALGQGTSYRLSRLYQQAGSRLGVPVTTRGRGPHFGLPVVAGFGDRTALSAYVSWNGSDQGAHTIDDNPSWLDASKLVRSGRTTLLVLSVLSREESY